MPLHLSLDTKKRIIQAHYSGKKTKEIAELFQVHERTVFKLIKKSKMKPEGIQSKKGYGSHQVAQLVMEGQKEKRIKRCLKLWNLVKRRTTGPIFFTDESLHSGYPRQQKNLEGHHKIC